MQPLAIKHKAVDLFLLAVPSKLTVVLLAMARSGAFMCTLPRRTTHCAHKEGQRTDHLNIHCLPFTICTIHKKRKHSHACQLSEKCCRKALQHSSKARPRMRKKLCRPSSEFGPRMQTLTTFHAVSSSTRSSRDYVRNSPSKLVYILPRRVR